MEQWLPIRDWPKYEVSTLGRVRRGARILKPWPNVKWGRLMVGLSDGNRKKCAYVHILVLEAFVGLRPAGMEACHFDDDFTNNAVENLRWDTHSANMHDAVRNGRHWARKEGGYWPAKKERPLMANRRQAPVDVVEYHSSLIEEAAEARQQILKDIGEADDRLREVIKEAFDAGLTAGPIKRASGLSESRLYQIRDNRRH